MELQASHGAARRVMGVGPAAGAARSIMSRMRSELGADAPPPSPSEQGIDTLVIMDREVIFMPCCQTCARSVETTLGLQCAKRDLSAPCDIDADAKLRRCKGKLDWLPSDGVSSAAACAQLIVYRRVLP